MHPQTSIFIDILTLQFSLSDPTTPKNHHYPPWRIYFHLPPSSFTRRFAQNIYIFPRFATYTEPPTTNTPLLTFAPTKSMHANSHHARCLLSPHILKPDPTTFWNHDTTTTEYYTKISPVLNRKSPSTFKPLQYFNVQNRLQLPHTHHALLLTHLGTHQTSTLTAAPSPLLTVCPASLIHARRRRIPVANTCAAISCMTVI